MIIIIKNYKLSQLIIDHEHPHYADDENLKDNKKINLRIIEHPESIKNITTPDGKELTAEELFDFVIGSNITDFARIKNKNENVADIAIVLGNIALPTTRERAIKAFELYKLGIVKKIIFTGGINKSRDKKDFMHPASLEAFMSNALVDNLEWEDLPEADWGAETFVPYVFDEYYQKHLSQFPEDFLNQVGINPEDILTESLSTSTQENATFCKNIFESEELETGMQIKNAIIVTTCTHGNRAMRQFKKVFGDKINFKWCPSTLDLEKHESLKAILNSSTFDEIAFRQELKRLYCTIPKLTQMLREEIGHHRNVFIRGEIDEPIITITEKETIENFDEKSR